MQGMNAYETYIRGGEAAANNLAGLAVTAGYLAPAGQRIKNTAPLLRIQPQDGVEETAAARRLRETTSLVCRIAGQLSYWVLTDAVPFDKDAESDRLSTGKNTDDYITGAFYASGLASTCSATTRAGEGGSPLLHYAPVNVLRVLALIKSAEETLDDVRVTNAAEVAALRAVLAWCTNTAKYCKEVSKIDEGAYTHEERSVSPRTMRRISTVDSRRVSPQRSRSASPHVSPHRSPRDGAAPSPAATPARAINLSTGLDTPMVSPPAESVRTSPTRPAAAAPLGATTPMHLPPSSAAAPVPSAARNAWGGTPTAAGGGGASSPRPLPKWAGQGALPLTEERLQHLFRQYDSEGRGFITVHDMRDIWDDCEVACLPQAKRRLEETLAHFAPKDGKVGYDEFSIVMYKLFSM